MQIMLFVIFHIKLVKWFQFVYQSFFKNIFSTFVKKKKKKYCTNNDNNDLFGHYNNDSKIWYTLYELLLWTFCYTEKKKNTKMVSWILQWNVFVNMCQTQKCHYFITLWLCATNIVNIAQNKHMHASVYL